MAKHYEADRVLTFVGEHSWCKECDGWVEVFRKVVPAGPGRANKYVFDGVELKGRANHHFDCPQHPRNEGARTAATHSEESIEDSMESAEVDSAGLLVAGEVDA